MLELIQYLHLQSSFYLWFSSRGSCGGGFRKLRFPSEVRAERDAGGNRDGEDLSSDRLQGDRHRWQT